jgi:putative endonuclease
MWYVYIIESLQAGTWYYGHTNDLCERLEAHNAGWNISTKGRRPWRYIFKRQMGSLGEVVEFEKHLKQTKNKTYIRRKYSQYFIS